MAGLPQIKRLQLEDFKNEKKWISPLLQTLNTFMESVVSAFNKTLTLVANTTSDIKTVTLSVVPTPNTDGGAGGPVSIQWQKPFAPVAVLVGAVQKLTGNPPLVTSFTLATAVQVQFSMSPDNKYLWVTGVAGITPSTTTQYVLTLICIAG